MDYLSIVTGAVGGFALFIYGMHIMGDGLQKSAGTKMKKLLGVLTRNKLMGVLLGIVITAIIQSSSATTVMVVGFVNAGIMNLAQSVGIIMGANIGTTVTAWLVSLMEISEDSLSILSPTVIAPFAAAIGAMMVLLCKSKKLNLVGEILAGLGMLFVGMSYMTSALSPLGESEAVASLFVSLGSNPLFGILAGTIVTGLIQSSAASVGILQSLAMAGIMPWNAAVFIIMGQNIGTCVTALLSSIGTSKNAKAASYIHLLFNVIGTVIFTIIGVIFFNFINTSLGTTMISSTEISAVHTAFNLSVTVLLYPFTNYIIRIAEKLSNMGKAVVDEAQTVHLDDRMLQNPSFALESSIKETVRMANITLENFDTATSCLLTKDNAKTEKVYDREKSINSIEKAITAYLVKLANVGINEHENTVISTMFHTVHDIERVGDHSENIAELADSLAESEVNFSETAVKELSVIISKTRDCLTKSISALENDDIELAKQVAADEEAVDKLEEEYRTSHIQRLAKNECTVTTGVIFLDTLTNLERISDHALNIAEQVIAENK